MISTGALGRIYTDGEIIIRQGDAGDCMYVMQSGHVEVFHEVDGKEVHLTVLGPSEVFGQMALFEREKRSASVRAKGEARILTVDKRLFLRTMMEDPALVFRILKSMSHRIRELSRELAQLKSEGNL